jgi:hypothetical protein
LNAAAPSVVRPTPFRGLLPFREEDAALFFGRDSDRRVITANLLGSRLTVLYGESGVGKSSVLWAGVLHHLHSEEHVVRPAGGGRRRVAVGFSQWRGEPRRGLAQAIAKQLGIDEVSHTAPLAELLEDWTVRAKADLLLVLDQFEESFPDFDAGSMDFGFELMDVIKQPQLRVNVLLSLREDALAGLDRFKAEMPSIFSNLLRIDHLRTVDAKAAILRPIDRYNEIDPAAAPVTVADALVDAIVTQVRLPQRRVLGTTLLEDADRVATPLLGLVLERLWRHDIALGGTELKLETLEALGGAQHIADRHFGDVLDAMPPEQQALVADVAHFLVTPSLTKIPWSIRDLADTAKVDRDRLAHVMRQLDEARIVRSREADDELSGENRRYEIFHDMMARALLSWRARRLASGGESSRESAAGAGWQDCGGRGSWAAEVAPDTRPLSWMRPSRIWVSRNDVLAKRLGSPVERARAAWVAAARQRGRANGWDDDFVAARSADDASGSFLLLGDAGEGNESQYAVAASLLSQADGTAFTVLCGHAVATTGARDMYETTLHRPYRKLNTPLLAVPGADDWYDGLDGFMRHFCDLELSEASLGGAHGVRDWLASKLWRRSPGASPDAPHDRPLGTPQPGPYWAVDLGPIRVVGVDTGITGSIDTEQAEWLKRVSYESDRPKILVAGRAFLVNGNPRPTQLEDLDQIVRDPVARYVLAVGGGTHNYQRYPVRLPDGRTLNYVVSGGGGGQTHGTHHIPPVSTEGVTEYDFRCYPLRSDSLALFSRLYDKRLAGDGGFLALTPAEAAAYLGELFGQSPTRLETVPLTRRARRAARFVARAPAERGFHRFALEFFDWVEPPFFKHFLRIDATEESLRVRCFGVTGCARSELAPPVEDEFKVLLR